MCNLHYEKFANGSVRCIEDEIPFDLPEGWAWSRIKNIASIGTGATPLKSNTEYYVGGKISWITSAATCDNIIKSATDYITELAVQETNCQIYPVGTLVVAMYGEGKTRGQISELGIAACTNQACAAIQVWGGNAGVSQLVKMFFSYNYENIRMKAKGGQQPNLNQSIIAETLIPIPPENEIMRLLDFSHTCLNEIQVITENKERTFQLANQARTKILDLAIRGKLVPQDPNDEPASVLLERIRAEKEELIKQGKIKRDKKESVIFRGEDNSYYEKIDGKVLCIDDNIPFEIPESWAWCRGYSCFEGMTSIKPQGEFFDYIDIDAIDNRNHCIKEAKRLPVSKTPSRASRAVKSGSVLFSLVRPYLENIALVEEEHSHCIASTGFYICNSNGVFLPEFMFFLMVSRYVVNGLNQYMKGDNSPSISKDNIENWLYPVPPLEEQKTICFKLKDAFSAIERMEKSLS